MKIQFLLLLPSCVFAVLGWTSDREGPIDYDEDYKEQPMDNKAKLQKSFGFDPETRRARLEHVLSKRVPTLTTEQEKELKEAIAKLVPIKTEKPAENETADLFEVNAKEGVLEYFYEGDMHLTESQLSKLEESTELRSRGKRQASAWANKWTDGNVYYCFDESIGNNDPCGRKVSAVYEALYYIVQKTCFNFIQNCTAPNRIRVMSGAGCYSTIGMAGGVQDLSLGDGCDSFGTAAHEFMHALGIWHMQQRSDRDSKVIVDTSGVAPDMRGNFDKLDASENNNYTPYEYGSTMHYPANAFTKNGKLSLIAKDARYAYTMGSKHISFLDIKMLNQHYQCKAYCPPKNTPKCVNGGYQNPRNPTICNCPDGFGGPLCNQRPDGCGETLIAQAQWATKQITVGKPDEKDVRIKQDFCNHWIKAPAGKKVQVKITAMTNPQCQYGCPFNGIEPKILADPQVTNPRFCCPAFVNQEFTSELNPTPIISYNRFRSSTFTLQFRYV